MPSENAALVAEGTSQPRPPRSYWWGKFQGWGLVITGIIIALAVPASPYLPLAKHLAGLLLIFTGLGLARKKLYGLVLFYGVFALVVAGCILTSMSGEGIISATAFWLIPAIFYYPKRRREFGPGI